MAASQSAATHALFTLDWYRTLSAEGRRAFWAAAGGYALAAFDLLSFTFVLRDIRTAFGLSEAAIGLLATGSLVASVVGGVASGVLADRVGRVRVLLGSIIAYAALSLASGLAQDYAQFFLARVVLGMAFGAEWTAGALLVAEAAAPSQRGRLLGVYAAAYSVGDVLATVAYVAVHHLLPGAQAWRALLLLGLAPALLVWWARSRLVEPGVSGASRPNSPPTTEQARGSPLAVLLPPLVIATVGGSLLASGIVGGKYIVNIWLPSYLQQTRLMDGLETSAQVTAVLAAAIAGSLLGGYAQDGLGRRRTFLLFSVASALSYWLYVAVPRGADALLLLVGLPLGFCTAGAVSGLGAYLAELYPSGVRGVGQGLTYNVGRGASGLVAGGIGAVAAGVGLGEAIAVGACVYAIAVLSLLLLPETRGRSLAPASAKDESAVARGAAR